MDLDKTVKLIEDGCSQYEKSSPYVSNYLNDLYIRICEAPDEVVLSELLFASRLVDSGIWLHPNTAQNDLYHLMTRLNLDTTGMIGF